MRESRESAVPKIDYYCISIPKVQTDSRPNQFLVQRNLQEKVCLSYSCLATKL